MVSLVGVFGIYRQEVRPFTDKQIELLQNFAAQAVIAIENTRLLNELRQRTADLTESLEQQTATSEVLQVISSSAGELKPVFDTMLAQAMRICEANFGQLLLFDGETFSAVTFHNAPERYVDMYRKGPVRPAPGTGLGRLIATKDVVHIADISKEHGGLEQDSLRRMTVDVLKARTFLAVPMLKDSHLAGAIVIYRREVRPFTDKQIALVRNFAAQAVIAIENTRLLSELRQSLEQQTATAEVLGVISSSPGDLAPVFQSMLQNATRICEANFGVLMSFDGEAFRVRRGRRHVPGIRRLHAAARTVFADVAQPSRAGHGVEADKPHRRLHRRRGQFATRHLRRRPFHRRRADAQGWRLDGRRFHLPAGSASLQ